MAGSGYLCHPFFGRKIRSLGRADDAKSSSRHYSGRGAAPDRPGSWVGERALLRRLEPQHALTAAAKARLCVAIKRYFVTLLHRGHVEEVAPESLRRESRCRQIGRASCRESV